MLDLLLLALAGHPDPASTITIEPPPAVVVPIEPTTPPRPAPVPPPAISWSDRWYWHLADQWGQAFDGIDRDALIALIVARNAGLPHKWPHTIRACPGPHETPAQAPPAVVHRWLPRN